MTNQILSNNNAASNVFAQTFGTTSTSVFVIQLIDRNPTTSDIQFPIRQKWVNTTTDEEWLLESFTSSAGVVTANWSKTGHGNLGLETLTGNLGGPVASSGPPNYNIDVYGLGVLNSGVSSAPNIVTQGNTSPNLLQILNTQAQFMTNVTSVNHAASPYTVALSDNYLSVDCSAGAVTLQLPDTNAANRIFEVKDSTGSAATNNISITTVSGTDTIDGLTTYKIVSNYGSVNIIWNGTNYSVW